jgi:hypothetical protein
VRGCVERRSRSNGAWMEATGCATAAAICTCGPAQKRCGLPQVLPAYGLQDLRKEKTVEADISFLLKTGHFYFALTRTDYFKGVAAILLAD